MIKSIKHFAEESISIFEKLEDDFFKLLNSVELTGQLG